jgi:hypothetical protein
MIQGQEKQRLESRAKINCREVLDCQFSATLKLKSQLYEKLDGLTANVDHKHRITRRNIQADSKVTANKDADSYKAFASVFGNGDSEEGKFEIKASLETPITEYRKQFAELKSQWSNEKITVDHKIESARINVALKSDVNFQLVKGPHHLNIVFDVKDLDVQPFKVVLRHEKSGDDLLTNVKVTELRNEKTIVSGSSRLQVTDERLAGVIEGEVTGKPFRHESVLVMKNDELAIDSKTHWENEPIATIKARLHMRQPSFVDIDCPIFKLRAEADSSRVPTSGSVDFVNKIGQKEQLKYRFTVEEGKSVEAHFEGKSAIIPEYKADLRARATQNLYDLSYRVQKRGQELSRGEGKVQWQKGQAMRIELKNNDYSHNSDIAFTGNAFTLTSKSMADQKPLLVISVQKNAKDATRFNMECPLFDARVELSGRGESPASAVFDFKGKAGDKLVFKTKISQSRSEGLVLSGECKSDSLAPHSAIVQVKRSRNGISVVVNTERNNREWLVGRALLEEIPTGLRVDGQVSEWGEEIARIDSQLHRNLLTGPHNVQINFKTPSADSQVVKITHEVKNGEIKCRLTHHIRGQEKQRLDSLVQVRCPDTLECQFSAKMSLKSLLYKELDGYTVALRHQHRINRKNLQVESEFVARKADKEYKGTLEVMGNGDAKQGKLVVNFEVETPLYEYKRFKHMSELVAKADQLALDSKTIWNDKTIAMIKGRIQDQEPSFVDIDCLAFKLRADADTTRAPATGSLKFSNKMGNREELDSRFTTEDGKSFRVHVAGKSAKVPEITADLKAQMSPEAYFAEYLVQKRGQEMSRGEGKIDWQGQGVRANGRVTRTGNDFAQFNVNAADDLMAGPHDLMLQFVTPRSNPYRVQMKHQLIDGNLQSSSDVHVDGKERLAYKLSGRGALDALAGLFMQN